MFLKSVVPALGAIVLVNPIFAQQLRVVTMNASNTGSATAAPRAGMEAVLSAIGSTVSDDPTIPGVSGVVRAVDVLCLQESRSSLETAVPYANLLNQIYGTSRYAAGTLNGTSTGSGTQVVVYNRDTVSLLGMAAVGTTSATGLPRQVTRYQFRPVGYTSSAGDVFIYNMHTKAGNTATDRDRRLVEAQVVRADADALGANRNIIYLGDLNVYRSSEPMYAQLLASGNGQALDPIATPGDWSNNIAFKAVHTQSPWDSALAAQTGFNGTSGGVDDRFDQQLVTSPVMNGSSGLQYVVNSYSAFGNDGSHQFDQSIDTGTGASPAVLNALAGILDHLPVLADYQLRPRLGLAHPGDADLDLSTDIDDFAVLAGRFNQSGQSWFTGDFTGDGVANIDDFGILAANFNTVGNPGSLSRNAIPEPAAAALLACIALLPRRRR